MGGSYPLGNAMQSAGIGYVMYTTVNGKLAGSYVKLVGMICPASVVSRVPYNPDTYNTG
jgi:hypothetical protein